MKGYHSLFLKGIAKYCNKAINMVICEAKYCYYTILGNYEARNNPQVENLSGNWL